jgi:threonyl-tRNA synthetase
MITLTFPDGAQRQYQPSVTGREVAEGIAKSLAKRTVAMALDGVVTDLSDPITRDARIEFIGRDDPRALELIRHDCAHVLAEAVQTLFPGTQVTIGPVIENGFYYDFARPEPFSLDDFPAIEAKMREIIARDAPFTKTVMSRDEAHRVFAGKGETFKLELIDAIRPGEDLKIYAQGDWFDLCRGPHMTSTGKVGSAFILARGLQEPNADAHLRDGLGEPGGSRGIPPPARGGREARSPAARSRDGPLPFPGGGARRGVLAPEWLDPVPGGSLLYASPPEGRLCRG